MRGGLTGEPGEREPLGVGALSGLGSVGSFDMPHT
jgi:hypothetical protein